MPIRRRPKGPGGGQFAPNPRCEQIEADIAWVQLSVQLSKPTRKQRARLALANKEQFVGVTRRSLVDNGPDRIDRYIADMKAAIAQDMERGVPIGSPHSLRHQAMLAWFPTMVLMDGEERQKATAKLKPLMDVWEARLGHYDASAAGD